MRAAMADWLPLAVLATLAACGEPTMQYELVPPADLTQHKAALQACVSACDVAVAGEGCTKPLIEIGDKCLFDCVEAVRKAQGASCLSVAVADWNCAKRAKWKCPKGGRDAVPADQTCKAQAANIQACLGNAAPAGDVVGTACQSWCQQRTDVCQGAAMPAGCTAQCTKAAAVDAPAKCAGQAAALLACQAGDLAGWTCDPKTGLGIAPDPANCPVQYKALQACKGGGTATPPVCVAGTTFCDGTKVTKCDAQGKQTSVIQDCAATSWLCKDGKCVSGKTCAPVGQYCEGENLWSCNGTDAYKVQDCAASGKICKTDKCVVSCTPDTYRCAGNELEICSASGSSWQFVKGCYGADACSSNKCDATAGKCVATAIAAGTACDEDVCLTNEKCDGQGKCAGGKPVNCDDGVACTADLCEPTWGSCKHTSDSSQCEDGNVCTTDTCSWSGCVNKPNDGNCAGEIYAGHCYTKGSAGSVTWAEAEANCASWPGGHLASISDANENAAVEQALGLSVSFAWIGGKWIDGVGTWSDGATFGYALWSKPPPKSGNYAITMGPDGDWDVKTPSNLLSYYACEYALGTTCDDGDKCTQGDKCSGGKCAKGNAACDDANGCTVDLCDPATATLCSHKPVPVGAACDDGQACTKGDACAAAGLCASSTPVDCDDANACTQDACTEPGGCNHTKLPETTVCGAGLVCVAGKCAAEGTCGDNALNATGEQCDDGNQNGGDGCSQLCKVEAGLSCAVLLSKWPNLQNGLYTVDPDNAAGPQPPLQVYCDMTGGGWTLVANVFDSPYDDVPNLAEDVTNGWQQVGDGQWQAPVAIAKVATDTGSAVAALAWVAAMKGAGKLRFCFVGKDGQDAVCRTSPTELTLTSYGVGNAWLNEYKFDELAFTYGRLIGLPATVTTFNLTKLTDGKGAIACSPGLLYEFGQACSNQKQISFAEVAKTDGWGGVWCAQCQGMCFRPAETDDDELGVGPKDALPAQKNPLPTTYGFRIYVAPP